MFLLSLFFGTKTGCRGKLSVASLVQALSQQSPSGKTLIALWIALVPPQRTRSNGWKRARSFRGRWRTSFAGGFLRGSRTSEGPSSGTCSVSPGASWWRKNGSKNENVKNGSVLMIAYFESAFAPQIQQCVHVRYAPHLQSPRNPAHGHKRLLP